MLEIKFKNGKRTFHQNYDIADMTDLKIEVYKYTSNVNNAVSIGGGLLEDIDYVICDGEKVYEYQDSEK